MYVTDKWHIYKWHEDSNIPSEVEHCDNCQEAINLLCGEVVRVKCKLCGTMFDAVELFPSEAIPEDI